MENKTLDQQAATKHNGKFAGDFVLKDQVTHDAFTHVNATWVSKTKTFEQIIKEAKEFQSRTKDYEGSKLSDFSALNGKLSLKPAGQVVASEHAIGQLGFGLGAPGTYLNFLAEQVPALFDTTVTQLVERSKKIAEGYQLALDARQKGDSKPERPAHIDREVFVRTVEKNGDTVLRAILSSRYAVINNLPVLETLNDIVPGGRVSHLHYDGDTLRANILVPDSLRQEDDSDYGGGISVLNNETGRFPLTTRPFVFRSICYNGNIWDRHDGVEFNRRHVGTINWRELRKLIVLNIQKQLPLAQANIEKVLALKGIPVTEQEIQQAIIYVGRRERLTQEGQRAWFKGYQAEPKASAFGLVQGLTRAAQTFDSETQELMESLSGRLIDGKWDRTLSAARNAVTVQEAQEVLAQ